MRTLKATPLGSLPVSYARQDQRQLHHAHIYKHGFGCSAGGSPGDAYRSKTSTLGYGDTASLLQRDPLLLSDPPRPGPSGVGTIETGQMRSSILLVLIGRECRKVRFDLLGPFPVSKIRENVKGDSP